METGTTHDGLAYPVSWSVRRRRRVLCRPVLVVVPALLGAHVLPGLLWRAAVAGTVCVPLLALSSLGLPVLGEGGGGWASPTAMVGRPAPWRGFRSMPA